MKSTLQAVALLVAVAAVPAAAIGYSILSRGLSTRAAAARLCSTALQKGLVP